MRIGRAHAAVRFSDDERARIVEEWLIEFVDFFAVDFFA